MKRIAAAVLLMTLALAWAGTAGDGRVVISLTADQVYHTALAVKDVWWQPGEPGIHLARRIVVETDSPGCGRRDSDAGVTEEISGATVLRKEFELSTPVPKGVQLAFVGRERIGHNADLEFVVNGNIVARRPTRLSAPDAKQYLVPDPAKKSMELDPVALPGDSGQPFAAGEEPGLAAHPRREPGMGHRDR